jgi:hypothetical protein
MAKKQTIIKKPVGNGNISITIENNLKNTNPAPVIPKKRRRRRPKVTDETLTNSQIEDMLRGGDGSGGGGGGGGGGPPSLKDVSYIRPPTNNFTVWRDHMNSHNTTVPMQSAIPAIPEGQARQMGLIPPPTVGAPPNPDNGSMTLRDFAMFMGGNNRMTRNNALQNNDMNDDEEMNVLTRANSPTSFNNVIDSSTAINQAQKDMIKQEYSNRQIGQVKRAGTIDGQSNKPPNTKYVNNPDLAVHYFTAYNAAQTAQAARGVPEPRTRAERAALAAAVVEEAGAALGPPRTPGRTPGQFPIYPPLFPSPAPPLNFRPPFTWQTLGT